MNEVGITDLQLILPLCLTLHFLLQVLHIRNMNSYYNYMYLQ